MDSPTKSDTLLQTEDSPVSQSITVDPEEETKVQGDGITGNNTKRPKRQRSKGKNSKETQREDVAESEVLYQVLDSEHKVADRNGVAVTVGDVEFKRIKVKGGKSPREHELWFRMERYPDNKKHMKPPIKVFVDIKVKRVSDIDAAAGTYRMRFHILLESYQCPHSLTVLCTSTIPYEIYIIFVVLAQFQLVDVRGRFSIVFEGEEGGRGRELGTRVV